jgi:hypothetical protein
MLHVVPVKLPSHRSRDSSYAHPARPEHGEGSRDCGDMADLESGQSMAAPLASWALDAIGLRSRLQCRSCAKVIRRPPIVGTFPTFRRTRVRKRVGHLSAAQFLLLLIIILASAKILGALAQRIGQPAVLGELVAGVAVGSSAFGFLDQIRKRFTHRLHRPRRTARSSRCLRLWRRCSAHASAEQSLNRGGLGSCSQRAERSPCTTAIVVFDLETAAASNSKPAESNDAQKSPPPRAW